jgi:hypothetical protein
MMRAVIRRVTVAALAILALGAVASASASASEFKFSGTGTLKSSAVTTPTFGNANGVFECTRAPGSGSTTVLHSTTVKVTIQYEGCSLFGLVLKVSPAEWEFNTNGTVKLLKAVTMKGTGCLMTYPVQTLSGVTYTNSSGKVRFGWSVSGIRSFASGTVCEYEEESHCTLTGTSALELVGGTVEVH